ncbi:hypothetical protein LP417_11785 [Polaromonas sp. P1-6]|nr:hypothetical protein LP417_11785 [Polaromonas sp. P1-6]UUZ66755.1 hypothetical protein LP416_16625 [Polaromonas sp. P2-4]
MPLAQKLLSGTVQVVEVTPLAMGDEGVRHAIEQRLRAIGQIHQRVALALRGEPFQCG